ncbi:hypothetical protein GGI35DRAFT_450799 [Trichoderma velutinum]
MNETTFASICLHQPSPFLWALFFLFLFFFLSNFLRLQFFASVMTYAPQSGTRAGIAHIHQVMPRVVLIRRSGSCPNVSSAFGVEKRVRRMQGPLKWS